MHMKAILVLANNLMFMDLYRTTHCKHPLLPWLPRESAIRPMPENMENKKLPMPTGIRFQLIRKKNIVSYITRQNVEAWINITFAKVCVQQQILNVEEAKIT